MNAHTDLKFEKVFGMHPRFFGKTVIISPFMPSKIFAKHIKNACSFQGVVYQGIKGDYQGRSIIFIRTGMGRLFVEDCLMALSGINTERVIFAGAAGAVRESEVGGCLAVRQACFDKSFQKSWEFDPENVSLEQVPADEQLLVLAKKEYKQGELLKEACVMSVPSLWNQNSRMVASLSPRGIDAVDLECAFFYQIARALKISPLALCYVSDTLAEKPYWQNFSVSEKAAVRKSMLDIIELSLAVSINC